MINTQHTAELDTAKNAVDIKTTIKKNEWGEWVVRLFVDGKHQPAADYFASDKVDATETAESMVLERKLKWPCPKLWAEKYEAEKEARECEIEKLKIQLWELGAMRQGDGIKELVSARLGIEIQKPEHIPAGRWNNMVDDFEEIIWHSIAVEIELIEKKIEKLKNELTASATTPPTHN